MQQDVTVVAGTLRKAHNTYINNATGKQQMIERSVHHAGMTPSRTVIAPPVKNEFTGKWCATFVRWSKIPGADWLEVRAGKMTSAPLFMTYELALEAADRAMDALEKTGMFPNMCEAF
jgi:hypothetical protein